MRLLLAVLILLHVKLTFTLSFDFARAAGEAGEAGESATGEGAIGEGANDPKTGEQGTSQSDGSPGDSIDTGCTIYSCPNGNANPASNSGGTGSSDENVHEAADIMENIKDVLEGITSIVLSTSDSTTFTITSKPPFPTAAHPCLSAQSIYSGCGSIYGTNFTNQIVSQQASCLCYQAFSGRDNATKTTTWVPGLFDGYVSQCDVFLTAQTIVSVSASVTGAGASAGATGICASVGDVRAGESVSQSASASSSTSPGSSPSPTTKQVSSTTTPTTSSATTRTTSTTAVPVAASTGGVAGGWNGLWMMGIGYCGTLVVMGIMIA